MWLGARLTGTKTTLLAGAVLTAPFVVPAALAAAAFPGGAMVGAALAVGWVLAARCACLSADTMAAAGPKLFLALGAVASVLWPEMFAPAACVRDALRPGFGALLVVPRAVTSPLDGPGSLSLPSSDDG